MPVTGSGEIKLRADVNNEINGNNTDTNVSLRALSNSAGESVPDALSEFYNYSSVSAPTLSYNSVSSNYTTITMNYTINWGGASGSYNLKVEIYESSSLGGSLYETVTITSASNPPSGDQSTNIEITPPSQYGDDDQDYQVIVKATNSEGTTSEPASGKRSVSVTQATQYQWSNMQNYNASHGWREYGNDNLTTGKVGSFMQQQANHPQLGWFTTHKMNRRINGNKGQFTLEQNVPNLQSSGTFAISSSNSADAYFRNVYTSNISAGSRMSIRTIFNMIYGDNSGQGYNDACGWQHYGTIFQQQGMSSDFNDYAYTDYNAVSTPTNIYPTNVNSISGFYSPSGTKSNYSGHAFYAMSQTGASNITATITGTLTLS
jgi:hypothetical protein